MMKKNNPRLIGIFVLGVLFSGAADAVIEPQTFSFPANGQFQLAISNTNPNLIVIPGDRVVVINSAAGTLTDKHSTKDGGVLFSSNSEKPFTVFIETEHGQVFSIQATPRKGEGRSYRLLASKPLPRPMARVWETSQPYESLLVELNKAVLQGLIPESYAPTDISNDRLSAPAGLSMRAEEAWVGNALRIVRYRVQNPHSYAVSLKEQDFWRQGVRAVMLGLRTNTLLPGASISIYITQGLEVNSGEH
ncbi:type-F conjugative transfer system secretin TraK [Yersinia ruckeri]|uniref:type-F conjugative transfer system secretin TraK n=1 Tax=Yersinia ruckeri TaxID=29486 RepID=UPI000C9C32ED|nr:type-F conjugative transfer system secretin TraK [Yersinia ruckeri]AUQ43897.1 type-F conjugative transfer system secretin TraK [Yersinia ruckeri]WMS07318.1 type-F conjugative transfer system secretin TraK [Yersinia ruckeri]